jgi:hypothetical protein
MTIILISQYNEVKIMQQSRKCPKCGSQMEKGISFGSVMGHPVGGTTIVKKAIPLAIKLFHFTAKTAGTLNSLSKNS